VALVQPVLNKILFLLLFHVLKAMSTTVLNCIINTSQYCRLSV
jgi:hypothetical protein